LIEGGTMWVVGLALKQPRSVGVRARSARLLAYTLIAWAASHLANLWGVSHIGSS
jgi:hypothetical protein